jgi:hypothetical protein
MGGAECPWYPFVLDGSMELRYAARVGWYSLLGSAWGRMMASRLEFKEEFLELGEYLGCDLCEAGIGRDKSVEQSLFIGYIKSHVVEMAFEFREGGKRMVGGVGGLEGRRREGDVVDCDGGRGTARAGGALFMSLSSGPLASTSSTPTMSCQQGSGLPSQGGAWGNCQPRGVTSWLWRHSIGDLKASPGGLFLCIFKAVNIFRDVRVFSPPAKHGRLEMGLETSTAGGEMVEVCR